MGWIVWKEVLHYDCAHGYTHKDSCNVTGTCRKMNLFLDYEEAVMQGQPDWHEKDE